MFQLCFRDEYGMSEIVDSSESYEELAERAKKEVSESNMENALVGAEQLSDWEVFWPIFFDEEGEPVSNVLYFGKEKSKPVVGLVKDSGEVIKYNYGDVEDVKVKFFIGTKDISPMYKKTKMYSEDYYAVTPRGETVDSFTNEELFNKGEYFIVKV
jgi:hypothetical protein